MTKFTDFAEAKNAIAFKEAFEDVLAAKVTDALEAKKVEVAVNFFNQIAEAGGVAGAKTPVKSHAGKLIDAAKKGQSKMPGKAAE